MLKISIHFYCIPYQKSVKSFLLVYRYFFVLFHKYNTLIQIEKEFVTVYHNGDIVILHRLCQKVILAAP